MAHYKRMFDTVASLAAIGVWEYDLDTHALSWTDTVYDLFEIPRGTPIQRSEIVALYEEASRREMEQARADALRSGRGFTVDCRVSTIRGNKRWIRISAEVETVDGRPVLLFGTKQDITREKEAQERIQTLQSELIYISRISAMNTMASTLAHELNQPLAAIASYMAAARSMAGRESCSSSLTECVGAAEEAALKAGGIIRRVRSLGARSGASDRGFALGPAVDDALALALVGYHGVGLVLEPMPEVVVAADRVQIQQVILNLVRNACEAAGPNDPRITIRAAAATGKVDITIEDNGPGIPEDIIEGMFEAFVTDKPQGMGLGLSISRTIVEAHHGTIRAFNLPEKGAALVVSLPLATCVAEAA